MGFQTSLIVEGVKGVRGPRLLFDGLSFEARAGTLVTVMGRNGSGKTSLLRMIAGLLAPAGGCIRLMGVEDGEERARYCAWLGEAHAVKSQLTVGEQLEFWAQLYGGKADAEGFGLSRLWDVRGAVLSAGQKRRVALARLSLINRPLWLLDEPFAALDDVAKIEVQSAIAAHCASGGVVVAASHERFAEASQIIRLGAP